MNSRVNTVLLVAAALAAPALAGAQPAPANYNLYGYGSPYGYGGLYNGTLGYPAVGPLSPQAAQTVVLPPDMQRKAVELARRQAGAKYDPVPAALDAKATENLEDFARWVSSVRMQREYAAGLLGALDSQDIARQAGAQELANLKAALTEQLKNRDGWLDRAIPAYEAQLRKNAEAKRIADSQPSMSPAGPPRPPNAPVIYKSPAYMVAVDGLYGDELGSAITAGNFPLRPGMGAGSPIPAEVGGKMLGKSVAILDIIQFGYSAGGWMGNEVIIHGQMRENHDKQQDYERRYKDYEREKAEWDAGGRGRQDWENWQARLRQERRDAASRQMLILSSLFGRASTWRPPEPPKPAIDPKLLEMLKNPPPRAAKEEVNPREMALRLNRMSTIMCHQPAQNDSGFKLSLSGFNGGRNDESRLMEILSGKPNGGSMGGAGYQRK